MIDPVSVNRQGGDIGTRYRTGVYFADAEDEAVIRESIARLQSGLGEPVAIEVAPMECYYAAEEYHQKYLDKNPEGYCHVGCDLFDEARNS